MAAVRLERSRSAALAAVSLLLLLLLLLALALVLVLVLVLLPVAATGGDCDDCEGEWECGWALSGSCGPKLTLRLFRLS